ncbi:hypothetical protein HX017_18440 [Myroides marinus]|uniref:2TM domain-containing protein n=1 Tax=Myroides marinus TaxID=703342 RepID=A0A164ASU9_9FLAO|nr:hypothetical protein [Myroides marinus]KUF40177.1 hypothetical protein AS361_02770 [Myroides marinus]KZE84791.1 hypothetical protein AV926_18715 [Myroides marinus]MDM1348906.1 hypothetical protein [Myroides marinus]MDM1352609.1 hypothetical protein [Myroides marinus]MDM1356121.1 hypothetical protein [Myroides marinus]
MKTITPYLLRFGLVATILTIIFRYFLSYGIENQSGNIITISAVIYGTLMFASGWYFGRQDGEYLPIYDVGFRFHLTTYLIHNGISLLWIGLGFGAKYENINVSIMVAVYWGIFLLVHFVFFLWARKKSINNLNKEDIFE